MVNSIKQTNMKNKITSFETACKALKLNPKKVIPTFSEYPKTERKAMIAHAKLVIIVKAINGDWVADWKNHNQQKFYPYFYYGKKGFVLSGYGCRYTCANVPSRLLFETSQKALYAGEKFIKLYKEYYNK